MITGLSSVFVTLIITLFVHAPVPNSYQHVIHLWQQVFNANTFIVALQVQYMLPSPRPYLHETRIINKFLWSIMLALTVIAFIITMQGSFSQIVQLNRWTTFLIVLCAISGVLVVFRRLQIERGWHHLYVIPPTLIAPPPMNATPIYVIMIVILPLLLLSTASTFWHNIDALNGIENIDMFLMSLCIFLAASLVLNYSPDTTTILSKLIGVGLFVITILIISLLLFLTPLIDDAYHAPHQMADQQNFRFVPLEGGQYQVHGLSDRQRVAMSTSSESILALKNEESLAIELDFDFPFYGQARRRLFVADFTCVHL